MYIRWEWSCGASWDGAPAGHFLASLASRYPWNEPALQFLAQSFILMGVQDKFRNALLPGTKGRARRRTPSSGKRLVRREPCWLCTGKYHRSRPAAASSDLQRCAVLLEGRPQDKAHSGRSQEPAGYGHWCFSNAVISGWLLALLLEVTDTAEVNNSSLPPPREL